MNRKDSQQILENIIFYTFFIDTCASNLYDCYYKTRLTNERETGFPHEINNSKIYSFWKRFIFKKGGDLPESIPFESGTEINSIDLYKIGYNKTKAINENSCYWINQQTVDPLISSEKVKTSHKAILNRCIYILNNYYIYNILDFLVINLSK